jgi:hypothetical protein
MHDTQVTIGDIRAKKLKAKVQTLPDHSCLPFCFFAHHSFIPILLLFIPRHSTTLPLYCVTSQVQTLPKDVVFQLSLVLLILSRFVTSPYFLNLVLNRVYFALYCAFFFTPTP